MSVRMAPAYTFDAFMGTASGKSVAADEDDQPDAVPAKRRRRQRAVLVCPPRNARSRHVVRHRGSLVLCRTERPDRQGRQFRNSLYAAA